LTADIESSEEDSSESEVSARNSLDSSSTSSESEEEDQSNKVVGEASESEEDSDSDGKINTKENLASSRSKRTIKENKMDDHIYYDKNNHKKQKRLKAAEREKRQTKREAKLAEKEFKRQVDRQQRIKDDRRKMDSNDQDFGLLGATPL